MHDVVVEHSTSTWPASTVRSDRLPLDALRGTVCDLPAYFPMKPTWVATLFLASALELRTNVHGIIGVFGDGECIALGELSKKNSEQPLLM